MANILILGGGFGGLVTAEKLASELGSDHQITLVSDSRRFIFYPALVRVALNGENQDDITFDLRAKLRDIGVRFIQGEAIRVNADRKTVYVAKGDFTGDISYDYLVFAVGRRLATEKAPGFFEYAHHLLSPTAALKFKKAVENFHGGNIIIGMCPGARLPVPVCETAFALASRFEKEISDRKISVMVVLPESVEEAFGGAKIYSEIEWAFTKHDIKLVENFSVKEISDKRILSDEKISNRYRELITEVSGNADLWDENGIGYDLLMLVPPFQGQRCLRDTESADESGFIKVNEMMQVEGLPHAYAAGDCAALPGPKLGQMAVCQAAVAARNIAAEIRGEKPSEIYYHQIDTIIDQGDEDSVRLHYGIWDEQLYRLQKGTLWSWAKVIHDRYWQAKHA